MPARSGPATAPVPTSFGSGALPITFESALSLAFAEDDQIVVEGVVEGDRPVGVSLRIDDGQSFDDASRFSESRMLPPGPFRFAVGVRGLTVRSGRTLEVRDLRRVIFSGLDGASAVKVSSFAVEKAAPLPGGAVGYSLGEANATVLSGFQRIGPRDPRVEGAGVKPIGRVAPDPLVASGLRGIERLKLAAPPGRVRVTLWLEDPGEWDYLPHPSERSVRINGMTVFEEKVGFEDWISRRYLRLADVENSAADDAWTAYGRHRGDIQSTDVDVGSDGLTIELIGNRPEARYLSAVLIEPAGQAAAFEAVQARRAEWYRSRYPVVKAPADADQPATAVALAGDGKHASDAVKAIAAPGTGVRLRLAVTSEKQGQPRLTLTAPERDGTQLTARLWAGERKLVRLAPSGNLLALNDDRLIADAGRLALSGEPRNYEIWVDVPEGAGAGGYRGSLKIEAGHASTDIPIEVEVLALSLPAVAKPAGFYLSAAPELSWFGPLRTRRGEQIACDLTVMRAFGLTGTAPPASLPRERNFRAFVNDMQIAKDGGVAPGWLVYNSVPPLVDLEGVAGAGDILLSVEKAMALNNIPKPVWNVADAPGNFGRNVDALGDLVETLRARAPELKLAAHFNNPADAPATKLFDTVIINAGYGIEAATIDKLVNEGRKVWLYDTDRPRATAGLWLWGTLAERYLQWHGRHPVADPFDPLDGREGDVHMIYPSTKPCPQRPDINRNLLRAAEGVVDQRWLAWLDAQSSTEAKDMARELRARVGSPWAETAKLSAAELDALRVRIVALASHAK